MEFSTDAPLLWVPLARGVCMAELMYLSLLALLLLTSWAPLLEDTTDTVTGVPTLLPVYSGGYKEVNTIEAICVVFRQEFRFLALY